MRLIPGSPLHVASRRRRARGARAEGGVQDLRTGGPVSRPLAGRVRLPRPRTGAAALARAARRRAATGRPSPPLRKRTTAPSRGMSTRAAGGVALSARGRTPARRRGRRRDTPGRHVHARRERRRTLVNGKVTMARGVALRDSTRGRLPTLEARAGRRGHPRPAATVGARPPRWPRVTPRRMGRRTGGVRHGSPARADRYRAPRGGNPKQTEG